MAEITPVISRTQRVAQQVGRQKRLVRYSSVVALLAGALLFNPASVLAAIITTNFVGSVYHVGVGLTGGGINVSDTVTGQFSYDTTATGVSSTTYPGGNFSLSIGSGFSAMSASSSVRVQNDLQNGSATKAADGLIVNAAGSITSDTINGRTARSYQFGLRKENIAGQLWPDTQLPDLSDWANVSLADIQAPHWHWMSFTHVQGDGTFDNQVRWRISDFSVSGNGGSGKGGSQGLPEPGMLGLFGGGLMGLLIGRRRKQ